MERSKGETELQDNVYIHTMFCHCSHHAVSPQQLACLEVSVQRLLVIATTIVKNVMLVVTIGTITTRATVLIRRIAEEAG